MGNLVLSKCIKFNSSEHPLGVNGPKGLIEMLAYSSNNIYDGP